MPPRRLRAPRTPPPASPGDARSTLVPGRPERRRGLAQRLAHREGEHQRAARRRPWSRRPRRPRGRRSSSAHVELLGHLGEARQLVGARRLGGQPAAGRAVATRPSAGPPASASRRPARTPPSIWPMSTSGDRLSPTSCTMSTRRSAVRAGEAVDLDLGRRGAVGEVLERRALHRRRSPSAGPRCGRSRPPTAAPAGSRPPSRARPGERSVGAPSAVTTPLAEAHVAGVDAEQLGRDRAQPVADLLAGVLDRAAVEVGARAAPRSPRCWAPCRCGSARAAPVDSGTPSAVAATCSILVCRPWPISVPPWLTSTEPSL